MREHHSKGSVSLLSPPWSTMYRRIFLFSILHNKFNLFRYKSSSQVYYLSWKPLRYEKMSVVTCSIRILSLNFIVYLLNTSLSHYDIIKPYISIDYSCVYFILYDTMILTSLIPRCIHMQRVSKITALIPENYSIYGSVASL